MYQLFLVFVLFFLTVFIQTSHAFEENTHFITSEKARPIADTAQDSQQKLVQTFFPHIPKEEIKAMENDVDKDRIAFYMAMLLSSKPDKSIATLSNIEKDILSLIQKDGIESEKVLSPYLTGLRELLGYLKGEKNAASKTRIANSIDWMNQVRKGRTDKDARAFTKALAFKDKKSILIAQALVGEDKGALSAFSALSNGEKNKFYLTIPASASSKDYFKSIGFLTHAPISIQTPSPIQMIPDFIKVSDWNLEMIKKIVKEAPTAIHDWKESSREKFNEEAASDSLGSEGQAKLLKSMREYQLVTTYDEKDREETSHAMRSKFQLAASDSYDAYRDVRGMEKEQLKQYQSLVDAGKHEEAFDWMQKHLNEWRSLVDSVDLFMHPKKELAVPIPQKGTLDYMMYEADLGKYTEQARPKKPSPVAEIIDSVREIHEGIYLMGVAGHGEGKEQEIIKGLVDNIKKVSVILEDTIHLKGTDKQRIELDGALKEILTHIMEINLFRNDSALNEKIFKEKIQKPLEAILNANFDILEFALPKISHLLNDPPSRALKEEAIKQIENANLPSHIKSKILEKVASIKTKEESIQ